MNEELAKQFDEMDIVPYTSKDRWVSFLILTVVVINLCLILIALFWGN